MSRGRKKVVPNSSDWESVFYNSVGTYVQYINLKLAEHIKAEPLSNHIRIAGGYAFKSSDYKKQGVPVIRISDFSNEKIVLDDVVYYDESEDLKRYELNEGDIVIALTGGTIAKLGIVQKGIGKLYLNQRVGKFEVLHPEEFETEYVYWIARSVQNIIKNLAWGAAIPNVSPKQIEELKFPIPDKETQNGIIDFLNDLRANKIEEDKEYFNYEVEDFIFSLQANQISSSVLQSELHYHQNLIRRLRQAFLQEGMQGKLTKQEEKDGNSKELLKKIKAEKEKLIAEKKLKRGKELPIVDEEIPFLIPESWVWCRLGEILTEIKYGTSQKSDYDSTKNSKVLRIPNVSGGILNGEDLKYTNLNLKEKTELSLEEDDILIVRSNGSRDLVGKTVLVTKEFVGYAYAGYLVRFRFNKKLTDPNFLRYATISPFFRELIETPLRTTVGINNINTEEMSNFLIPLPPLLEQTRIVKKLEKLINLCDEIANSISQSKVENEMLIKVLLNEALGVTSTYDVTKDKTLTQKVKKFYIDHENKIFDTINMNIIEILQTSQEPISAAVVWNSSEYSKDIEAFYAELKRLIDIEKLVVEEKQGKESFLKLAASEN